jgi:hypothetical protein
MFAAQALMDAEANGPAAFGRTDLLHQPVEVTEIRSRRQTTGWLLEQQAEMLAVLIEPEDLPRMDGPVVLRMRAVPQADGELGSALVEHAEMLTEGLCLVRMRLNAAAGSPSSTSHGS